MANTETHRDAKEGNSVRGALIGGLSRDELYHGRTGVSADELLEREFQRSNTDADFDTWRSMRHRRDNGDLVRALSAPLVLGGTIAPVPGSGAAMAMASGALARRLDGVSERNWGTKDMPLNGNLSPYGRKPYIFRDAQGKIEGYGTQFTRVMRDDDGSYVAIPTIVDGQAPMSDEDAFAHYKKTGEFFHRGSESEARAASTAAHLASADEAQKRWNEFLHANWDEVADSIRNDPGMREEHARRMMARARQLAAESGVRTNSVRNSTAIVSASLRQDAKGGEAGPGTAVSEMPASGAPAPQGGPRIVINPSTFRNKKDALCVAFNEAFRVIMEYNEFDPVSEPTDEQREFFSDTAYADDELQLRRTILSRICTFDTSVKNPTDEQLQEAVEFLETVMEIGAPQNDWEQSAVQRIHDVLAKSVSQGSQTARARGTAEEPRLQAEPTEAEQPPTEDELASPESQSAEAT